MRLFHLLTICLLIQVIAVPATALKIEKVESSSTIQSEPVMPMGQFDTKADHAYLLDYGTNTVLFSKKADEQMAPSSMSKLMTIYLAFHQLKSGAIKLEDEIVISERSWRMGGSRMFLDLGSSVKVEDLLKGIIIQSGNDASVALAEGIAGTEENFARYMNEAAKEIGLKNSTFTNATGWPDPEHKMSATDLAHLASILIKDYPEYYHYFAMQSMTYNKISQGNRNTLLGTGGVDGLKTGHTDDGGYGIVISAAKDDKRLIAVVNGLKNEKERAAEAARLLIYGFNSFQHHILAKAEEILQNVPIINGRDLFAEAISESDIQIMIHRKVKPADLKIHIEYETLTAPITQNQIIAYMHVKNGEELISTVPLHTRSAINEASMAQKSWRWIQSLLNIDIYSK